MNASDAPEQAALATTLMGYHAQLLRLAKQHLNPILLRRVSPEEVVQDTLADACRKASYLTQHPDVPLYFKLCTLLFQTITTLERQHLGSQKRDLYKEVHLTNNPEEETFTTSPWERFVDSATGPLTHATRQDRYELLKRAMAELPDNDRQLLEMRHFDNLTNAECAELLHLSPKAASIRYVRALERLQKHLVTFTEFLP